MLSVRHRNAIIYFLKKIKTLALFPYVDEIILFGSCAKHKEKYTSDIDIAIIMNDNPRNHIEEIRQMQHFFVWEKSEENDVDYDLHFFNKKTFYDDKTNDLFVKVIRKEGKQIWKT